MTNPLRGILPRSALALLAIAAPIPLNRTAAQSVTTVSWSGSYGRAVNEDVGVIGVVAGTPRMEEALRYLAFATSAESQARIGRRISYSPARRSGAPLVTTHVTAGVEMAPHMPASPENAKRALRYDWAWWVDNQDEMNERFSAWLAR